MNTNSAAAVVTGARHLRARRNGQDAVMTIVTDEAAVAVVCDGCSAGTSTEVGARLGARLFAREMMALLEAGAPATDERTWTIARERVVAAIAGLVRFPAAEHGDGLDVIDLAMLRECFLFTIIAAAITREGAAVWALGDGGYAIDGVTTRLGPFANNEPPYLAYDLLGEACQAHFATVPAARTIVIGTDGAVELVDEVPALEGNIACFGAARYLAHPDALRRDLARFARADERIDWSEQRVARTPALLQDDCAIAILQCAKEHT